MSISIYNASLYVLISFVLLMRPLLVKIIDTRKRKKVLKFLELESISLDDNIYASRVELKY